MVIKWQKRVVGFKNIQFVHNPIQATLCAVKTYQGFIERLLQNFQPKWRALLEGMSDTRVHMPVAEYLRIHLSHTAFTILVNWACE